MSDANETVLLRLAKRFYKRIARSFTVYGNDPAMTIAAAASYDDSTPIEMRDYSGGKILLGSGETATTLTFYESDTESGTYVQMYDTDGSAVSISIGGGLADLSVPLPDECFGSHWVKIAGNVAITTGKVVLKT